MEATQLWLHAQCSRRGAMMATPAAAKAVMMAMMTLQVLRQARRFSWPSCAACGGEQKRAWDVGGGTGGGTKCLRAQLPLIRQQQQRSGGAGVRKAIYRNTKATKGQSLGAKGVHCQAL